MVGLRFFEELGLIDTVEAACKESSHLHVLFLVLTYRHLIGLVRKDIRRHQAGVCQQTGIDVIRLGAGFLLEGSHALQFA